MTSFRIYNNIQKVINKREIKIINIPFNYQPEGESEFVEIGNVPLNISLLGVTATINDNDVDLTYNISIQVFIKNKLDSEAGFVVTDLIILKNNNKGCGSPAYPSNNEAQTTVCIRADKNDSIIPLTGVLTFHYYQM